MGIAGTISSFYIYTMQSGDGPTQRSKIYLGIATFINVTGEFFQV